MYVYIVECAGYHKVGIAADPLKRVISLQVGNPYELHFVKAHQVPPSRAVYIEGRVHRALGEYSVRGEWFSAPVATVLATVAGIVASVDDGEVIDPVSDRIGDGAPKCKICGTRHFGSAHIFQFRKGRREKGRKNPA